LLLAKRAMEFRILGPLEVVADGRVLPVGRGRQRALLAILLLRANQIIPTERLIDDLWGGEPPSTAPKMVQMYVAELRRALGKDVLTTASPGYTLRVEEHELDLDRFERLVGEARESDPTAAAALLRRALALWRGPPIGEFAYDPWAQTEIARLEELRLTALEDRFDADLATGRAGDIVGELEAVARNHPFRDRLGAQLMLALYRAGRQAEALQHYRRRRTELDEELGLEPSQLLQRLERAILTQDPSLDAPPPTVTHAARDVDHGEFDAGVVAPENAVLVAPRDEGRLADLLALAEPLAAAPPARELIVARVVSSAEPGALKRASEQLLGERDQLVGRGLAARIAVFTSPSPGEDIVRLASDHAVDLVLIDVSRTDPLADDVAGVIAAAPCDIALHVGDAPRLGPDAPVLVPFGGAEHDWAALELGAWIARSQRVGLTLLGSASRRERRDASRLLADASLLVQKTAGVVAEPLLSPPGVDELIAAAANAGLLVVGLSERWREEGFGPFRLALVERSPAPALFVRRGPRPGGLAPAASRTRYTWSLSDTLSAS
jgi:DNA-binding SARP family transcriptional activator